MAVSRRTFCGDRSKAAAWLKKPARPRVPADVVPPAHLVLEESRQQQALRACRFHHFAVVLQAGVEHEMVEHVGKGRRRPQLVVERVDTSA